MSAPQGIAAGPILLIKNCKYCQFATGFASIERILLKKHKTHCP